MSNFFDTARRVHLVLVLLSIIACAICIDYFALANHIDAVVSFEDRSEEIADLGYIRDKLHTYFYELNSKRDPSAYTQVVKTLEECHEEISLAKKRGQGRLDSIATSDIQNIVPLLVLAKISMEGSGEASLEVTSEILVQELDTTPQFQFLTADQLRMLAIIMVASYIQKPSDTEEKWHFDDSSLTGVVIPACRLFVGIIIKDDRAWSGKHRAAQLSAEDLSERLAKQAAAIRDWKEMLGLASARVSVGGIEIGAATPLALWLYLLIAPLMYTLIFVKLNALANSSKFVFEAKDLTWSVIYSRISPPRQFKLSKFFGQVYLFLPLIVMCIVYLLLVIKPILILRAPPKLIAYSTFIIGGVCLAGGLIMAVAIFKAGSRLVAPFLVEQSKE